MGRYWRKGIDLFHQLSYSAQRKKVRMNSDDWLELLAFTVGGLLLGLVLFFTFKKIYSVQEPVKTGFVQYLKETKGKDFEDGIAK